MDIIFRIRVVKSRLQIYSQVGAIGKIEENQPFPGISAANFSASQSFPLQIFLKA
jgi:hypothetical protein